MLLNILVIGYLFMFFSIAALEIEQEEEEDNGNYDYDFDYEHGDDIEEDYDEDYDYSYEGDIEDFDYDTLREIEKTLRSINLDPLPAPTVDEIEEYKRMKKMRASVDGLVEEDFSLTRKDDDVEMEKIKNSIFTINSGKNEL